MHWLTFRLEPGAIVPLLSKLKIVMYQWTVRLEVGGLGVNVPIGLFQQKHVKKQQLGQKFMVDIHVALTEMYRDVLKTQRQKIVRFQKVSYKNQLLIFR